MISTATLAVRVYTVRFCAGDPGRKAVAAAPICEQ
jgi:hypothetical protein